LRFWWGSKRGSATALSTKRGSATALSTKRGSATALSTKRGSVIASFLATLFTKSPSTHP